MSFTKRHLQYIIELNQGSFSLPGNAQEAFDNGSNTLNIHDIRSVASIQTAQGGLSPFVGRGLFQLFGMKPADMAKLSTLGMDITRINKNKVSVFAYDDGGFANAAQVFAGTIQQARLNYNAMPDVLLELDCYGAADQQTQAIPGTSVQGSGDVATMLQGICAACDPPVTFVNKGISAQLSNPAYAGSPEQQIRSICMDSGTSYTLQGGTLTVWDGNSNIDGVTIDTGPSLGMVGYPEYSMMGFDVTMEFNPEVQVGRFMNLKASSAPNAVPVPGIPSSNLFIRMVEHELSSEMPGGPWFTHAHVVAKGVSARG
jgi:hypothetical protein